MKMHVLTHARARTTAGIRAAATLLIIVVWRGRRSNEDSRGKERNLPKAFYNSSTLYFRVLESSSQFLGKNKVKFLCRGEFSPSLRLCKPTFAPRPRTAPAHITVELLRDGGIGSANLANQMTTNRYRSRRHHLSGINSIQRSESYSDDQSSATSFPLNSLVVSFRYK
eukprot:COSAG02_NODE_5353_length_4404_cov_3.974216_3_plen_168_part_00